MGRPTLALCMIAKNEAHHAKRLVKELEGLFDQYICVDTGSTDGTQDILKEAGWQVHNFEWVHDFAAARNETLKHVKTDYWLWLDFDDALHNKEGFLSLRDNLDQADAWLANYEYAMNAKGESVCTFARERIIKTDPAHKWMYFCHEGVVLKTTARAAFTPAFSVKHLRTEADMNADKGRNLKLFEMRKQEELEPRMLYYYGKELFEAGRKDDALKVLLAANQKPTLEMHDRILCTQYACYCLFEKGDFEKTIDLAHGGVMLDPTRAEFWVIIGDSYVKLGKYQAALPAYYAAQGCYPTADAGVIYKHVDAYGPYPRNNIARILFSMQKLEDALELSKATMRLYPENKECSELYAAIEKEVTGTLSFKDAEPCEDIVITCPGVAYEFDEVMEKTRGVGGSEIAAIEMARHLKAESGRNVIIFMPRAESFTAPSGVQYLKVEQMAPYFAKHKPALHIAWRHNYKLTDAKTLLWSHDLITPYGQILTYDKYLALSEFHSSYVQSMLGVPADKIEVVSNGIRPELFKPIDLTKKNPNKVVFVSSPDRGLIQAINVMEAARVYMPNLELHVFYGTDNLKKGGRQADAEAIEKEIDSRHWVKMHGNVPQAELLKHYETAAVWLYPTVFDESSCISALETLFSGVYPIVRHKGALPYTLGHAAENGCAEILDVDPTTMEGVLIYAKALTDAISKAKWEKLPAYAKQNLHKKSWLFEARRWLAKFI